MNNVPLLLESSRIKTLKRIELINRFQKNIWKLDNIGEKHLSELHKFSWLSQLDIKKSLKTLAKNIMVEWLRKNQNYNEKLEPSYHSQSINFLDMLFSFYNKK